MTDLLLFEEELEEIRDVLSKLDIATINQLRQRVVDGKIKGNSYLYWSEDVGACGCFYGTLYLCTHPMNNDDVNEKSAECVVKFFNLHESFRTPVENLVYGIFLDDDPQDTWRCEVLLALIDTAIADLNIDTQPIVGADK